LIPKRRVWAPVLLEKRKEDIAALSCVCHAGYEDASLAPAGHHLAPVARRIQVNADHTSAYEADIVVRRAGLQVRQGRAAAQPTKRQQQQTPKQSVTLANALPRLGAVDHCERLDVSESRGLVLPPTLEIR
jgi:hypothetical protein